MKIKNRTAEFKEILFYKGSFILVYNDGSYNIAPNTYYISTSGDIGLNRAVNYIDSRYDVYATELEILSIEKEIESKQNKIKELKNTLDTQRENLKELTNEY
jgi:hypothetical protein